jgi:DNA-directed RNA polymerase subunit M/transcription elongation factor TFIIS
MKMNTALPFSIILPVLILFSIDPDTTLVADNTQKLNYSYIVVTDDKLNKDKGDKKIQYDKHLCPNCKSYSLTFEGLKIHEGNQIQLINCRACGYEWQETWTLPNWFWLKSSSPNNHWTSERWNVKLIDADVQNLRLAQGIKDSLEEAGFHTVDSILKYTSSDISNKLGIDPYVAQIIKEAAKRATGESSTI